MIEPLRLAIGAGDPRLERRLLPGLSSRAGDARPQARSQRSKSPKRTLPMCAGRAAARCRAGCRRSRAVHGVDGAATRTIRRCSSAASSSFLASRAPPPPTRAASICKAPLLVGFFLAGLVIHGGLQGWWIAPVLASLPRRAAVLRRDHPDGLQRQRAHHLPGHARAGPERTLEDRGRRRRRHRRRPDGHRQRAQPGRPGDSEPLLRRRHLAALSSSRRAHSDADHDTRVSLDLNEERSGTQERCAIRPSGWPRTGRRARRAGASPVTVLLAPRTVGLFADRPAVSRNAP